MNDFEAKLQAIVQRRSGIVLEGQKLTKAAQFVGQRHRGRSHSDSLASLEMNQSLPDWLISHLTINETFFFRHPNQFDAVREWLASRPNTDRPLRCVCLGCSTGEEPYSLAMLLASDPSVSDFRVVGYDIDPEAVSTAVAAEYPQHALTRTPSSYRSMLSQYTETVRTAHGERLSLKRTLKESVKFQVSNCLTEDIGSADIVFARNVLIYFAPEDRERLLRRVQRTLLPGGLLLIGAGELLPSSLKSQGGPTWRLNSSLGKGNRV